MKGNVNHNLPVNIAGFAVGAAISVAAYMLVASPAMRASLREQQARQESAEATSKAQSAATQLLESQQRLTQIQSELESVAVQLIPPSRVNEQIDRMTTLAAQHKLRMTQMSPGAVSRSQWFTAVPIRMVGDGSFTSCVQFVEAVRKEFADVSIHGLKLTSKLEIAALASENDGTRRSLTPSESGTPAVFDLEFVWYAAPDGSAGAESSSER